MKQLWVWWRCYRTMHSGWCPMCNSSPPWKLCPVCNGAFWYGPTLTREERRVWVARYREMMATQMR